MRPVHWLFLLRVACLVAWGTSAALLIDYLSPTPTFCSHSSGCGAVRSSGLGSWMVPGVGSVPVLPLLGVAIFGLIFGASLLLNPLVRRRLVGPLAFAVAPVGLLLFGLQAALGAFCSLCLTVDAMAVVIGIAAFALRGEGWEVAAYEDTLQMRLIDVEQLLSEGQRVRAVWSEDSRIYTPPTPLVRPAPRDPLRLERWTWLVLGGLALAGPGLYPLVVRTSPTPAAITSLYAPGKINVVEFFDFECPHCRELGPRLEALLAPYGDRVHFVRQHVPLDQHVTARAASRVAICAEEQGLGAVVSKGFLTDVDFGKTPLEQEALRAGAQEEPLRSCLGSQRPDQRLMEHRARLELAGFEGLPTTYIGGLRVLGAAPDEVYRDALGRVEAGRDVEGLAPLTYWCAFAVLFFGVLVLGRKRPPADPIRTVTQH